jgi:Domain of unknown function (DUF4430)
VTRDFGTERLAGPVKDRIAESDTAMRVLDRNTEISTRYGGAFVQSINGLQGAGHGGRPYDWFFYVNGLWSPVGAAEYSLHGGEAIWWDYRDWSASERVSALVGSWPQPFAGGYEGSRHPTSVACHDAGAACAVVRQRLGRAGASLAPVGTGGAIRVLVGTWRRIRADGTAAEIESGPGSSGVYADFVEAGGRLALVGLDEGGDPVRRLGPDAGLVAATRSGNAPPIWVVTGTSLAGTLAAARLLDGAALRNRFAVASDGGAEVPLPVGVG